jgi:hypothetical protein
LVFTEGNSEQAAGISFGPWRQIGSSIQLRVSHSRLKLNLKVIRVKLCIEVAVLVDVNWGSCPDIGVFFTPRNARYKREADDKARQPQDNDIERFVKSAM